MLREFGATASTTLWKQLRTLVDGGSLSSRHGDAPIPKQRLQSEISTLFLRLFVLTGSESIVG
jgi:hypothetical protein